MKAKIIMLSALGAVSFGLTQAAMAWDPGACGASSPCVELDGGTDHFSDFGTWYGHPGGGSFEFSGVTDLSCPGLPTATCTLTLNGDVRLQSGSPDTVGIRVNSGSVSGGGLLCGLISISNFPWYLGDNGMTSGWMPGSGVDVAGPYVGTFGVIDVNVVPSPTMEYIKNVSYDNVNTFNFNEDLYEVGTTTSTGCSVVGDLELQNANSLTIF